MFLWTDVIIVLYATTTHFSAENNMLLFNVVVVGGGIANGSRVRSFLHNNPPRARPSIGITDFIVTGFPIPNPFTDLRARARRCLWALL